MVYNSIVILDYIMDTDSQLSIMLYVHNLRFCDLYFVHYTDVVRMCIIGCFILLKLGIIGKKKA